MNYFRFFFYNWRFSCSRLRFTLIFVLWKLADIIITGFEFYSITLFCVLIFSFSSFSFSSSEVFLRIFNFLFARLPSWSAISLAWSDVFLLSSIAKFEASVPFEFDLCEELYWRDLLDSECDDIELLWDFSDWPFELFERLLDDFGKLCLFFPMFSLFELK